MDAGVITIRDQFTDLFVDRLAYIDEILQENFESPESVYNQVFNVRSSNRAYEEITGITGFSKFNEKGEAEAVEYDALMQGFDKRFKHKTYAKGFQISMEAMDDDIDGAISNAGPPLSRAAFNTIEALAADVFNNAFTTELAPDGLSIINDSHLLVGGGLADNKVSGDLAQGTLEQAINLFDDMRDDRNELINGSPSILLYPPELRWLVDELLRSQLRSDSNVNAVNTITQLGLRPVMWKYLTAADSCFVLSEPSLHRILFYWRMNPVSDHTLDFDTGNMKSKMTFRCSMGAADWRNIVGLLGV